MKYPKGQNRKHKAANYSPKQERRVADLVGGKNTPASGAKEIKGDIRLKGLLRVECKATEKPEYILTHKVIDKIKEQALTCAELPCVQVDFLGETIRKVYILEMFTLPEEVVNNFQLTTSLIAANKKSILITKNSPDVLLFNMSGRMFFLFEESIFLSEVLPWINR
jgi:hypothetical protein